MECVRQTLTKGNPFIDVVLLSIYKKERRANIDEEDATKAEIDRACI